MPNEMSAAECAERLEYAADKADTGLYIAQSDDRFFLKQAAAVMRKLAEGWAGGTIHAHWAVVNTRKVCVKVACSWCGKAGWNYKSYQYCPSCGALMDEQEDKNAEIH
jgi:hypothetical protein